MQYATSQDTKSNTKFDKVLQLRNAIFERSPEPTLTTTSAENAECRLLHDRGWFQGHLCTSFLRRCAVTPRFKLCGFQSLHRPNQIFLLELLVATALVPRVRNREPNAEVSGSIPRTLDRGTLCRDARRSARRLQSWGDVSSFAFKFAQILPRANHSQLTTPPSPGNKAQNE